MSQTITARRAIYVAVALLLLVLLLTGGWVGCKTIKRGQARADAHNSARVELLKVEAVKARAEQRFQESVGIKRAQDEINRTLTPIYVQHEAIQAQRAIAESGKNNTVIYVPAGTNGTPTITQPAKPAPPADK